MAKQDELSEIVIEQGFPESLRRDAAVLYDSAFGKKLGVAIPDRDARLQLLADGFEPSYAFVARSNHQLLGIAGFKNAQGALTSGITFGSLRRSLGTFGSLRAAAILTLFERELGDGQLLMDGIAVSPDARGKGIGTKLLNALMDYGAREGFRTIRLDVIDTNPAARRLYERVGFAATGTEHFPYLRGLLGFSAATTMEYKLHP